MAHLSLLNNPDPNWCTQTNVLGEWIQAELNKGWLAALTSISTQGRAGHAQWVTSYQLSTSLSGGDGEFVFISDGNGDIITNDFLNFPFPPHNTIEV